MMKLLAAVNRQEKHIWDPKFSSQIQNICRSNFIYRDKGNGVEISFCFDPRSGLWKKLRSMGWKFVVELDVPNGNG